MVPDLKDLTYEERLKEMQLITLKERKKGDLITIHKLMNNLEETNINDLIMKIRSSWIRTPERIEICMNDTK